ncbi:MAG TPA: metal-dependent hydrolase [Candidatus Methanoperedens sp.]
MFIGHFGIGFGAKAAAPGTSLGSLFLASQFSDLLWPTLLLLGVERVNIITGITKVSPLEFVYYPMSHSLLAVLGWSLLVAVVYQFLRRYPRGSFVLGLAVVSHWILDVIVHRPDLPLYPGSGYLVGFGLWSSLWGTLVVELLIFGIGIGLYLRTTKPADRTGVFALWILVVFLLAIYLGDLFGPPPPNVTALAWIGQAQWLLVLWGYWIDRHRFVE